jgi:hypothetical protein
MARTAEKASTSCERIFSFMTFLSFVSPVELAATLLALAASDQAAA